ncbi:MAG: FAD:protein FMN transferase, partial [Clostridia bacterium]|nr:FAD:protein FMN transferase [Clostridia bacterium]
MKKISACLAAAVIAVASLSTLCACAQKGSFRSSFFAMDTAAVLAAADVREADFYALSDDVGEFLSAAENSLSVARTNSYISKFNQAAAGATVKLDEISYEVLTLAKEVYTETDGYFNPAVYYCEDIYGFAARPANTGAMPYDRADNTKSLPEEKYITAFKKLSEHFSEVAVFELDGTYYATKPDYTAKI